MPRGHRLGKTPSAGHEPRRNRAARSFSRNAGEGGPFVRKGRMRARQKEAPIVPPSPAAPSSDPTTSGHLLPSGTGEGRASWFYRRADPQAGDGGPIHGGNGRPEPIRIFRLGSATGGAGAGFARVVDGTSRMYCPAAVPSLAFMAYPRGACLCLSKRPPLPSSCCNGPEDCTAQSRGNASQYRLKNRS